MPPWPDLARRSRRTRTRRHPRPNLWRLVTARMSWMSAWRGSANRRSLLVPRRGIRVLLQRAIVGAIWIRRRSMRRSGNSYGSVAEDGADTFNDELQSIARHDPRMEGRRASCRHTTRLCGSTTTPPPSQSFRVHNRPTIESTSSSESPKGPREALYVFDMISVRFMMDRTLGQYLERAARVRGR